MFAQFHHSLKEELLAIEGMSTQPYQTKTGNTPQGGIEEFNLHGKYFAGLRLTDKYIMVYLGPVFEQADLATRYEQQLKSIRSGKACLKITKPEKTDISSIVALIREGARGFIRIN
ncbi:hypothetical protein LC612_43505 [Nostoc sp. CHAB 5834]|nr:hypothetical protein [Nostoc sp. CHAB 5834]